MSMTCYFLYHSQGVGPINSALSSSITQKSMTRVVSCNFLSAFELCAVVKLSRSPWCSFFFGQGIICVWTATIVRTAGHATIMRNMVSGVGAHQASSENSVKWNVRSNYCETKTINT